MGLAWYKFVAWMAREVVFRALGGAECEGLAHIPATGRLLIAPVHLSFLDPPLVACFCTRPLRFMAKQELFRNRMVARLLRSLGAFPVNRGGADRSAVKTALEILKSENVLLMFPEGSRNDAVTLGNFLPGVVSLSLKTGSPIVPVGISGTQNSLSRSSNKLRRSRLKVVFGPPISPCTDEQTLTVQLRDAIQAATSQAGLSLKSAE